MNHLGVLLLPSRRKLHFRRYFGAGFLRTLKARYEDVQTNTNAQLLRILPYILIIHSDKKNLRSFPLFCWSLVCFVKIKCWSFLIISVASFFNSFETVNQMQAIVKNLSYQELSNSNFWNFDATFESIYCNVLQFTQAKLDYYCKTPASNLTLAERDKLETTFRPRKTCQMQRFDFNAQHFPINDRVQFHQ